jgi:DNA repair protein RecO (recombination protein O)
MPSFSTPAIVLRRLDYSDYDLIVTFFTLEKGKLSLIAKYAKKSSRRFAGQLELFSLLDIVASTSRKGGMPVLQEAAVKDPYSAIRSNFQHAAYASYWAEMICDWMEEYQQQAELFELLRYVLTELDRETISAPVLSLLFQLRFLNLAGHGPNLTLCALCHTDLDELGMNKIYFHLDRGGIVCNGCASKAGGALRLSKGTIKQMLWINRGTLSQATRVRFSPQAIREALQLLEAFVPYHLGKHLKSLRVLQQVRDEGVRRHEVGSPNAEGVANAEVGLRRAQPSRMRNGE